MTAPRNVLIVEDEAIVSFLIEDMLREAGYMALLGNTDGDPERERELLAAMRGRQTDGFILATGRRDLRPETDRGRPVPTVLVNRRSDASDVPDALRLLEKLTVALLPGFQPTPATKSPTLLHEVE